jgi:hypothetical protein
MNKSSVVVNKAKWNFKVEKVLCDVRKLGGEERGGLSYCRVIGSLQGLGHLPLALRVIPHPLLLVKPSILPSVSISTSSPRASPFDVS